MQDKERTRKYVRRSVSHFLMDGGRRGVVGQRLKLFENTAIVGMIPDQGNKVVSFPFSGNQIKRVVEFHHTKKSTKHFLIRSKYLSNIFSEAHIYCNMMELNIILLNFNYRP